ncbi:MAG: DUF5610 domain-containing protein [Candidatus Ozemobacteraceae bacterium]
MVESIKLPTALLNSLTSAKNSQNTSDVTSLLPNSDESQTDLFQGLNIDQLGLSSDAKNKLFWARAQFEVNYQAIRSINSSQGQATSQETFSFQSSFEFLQRASGQDSLFSSSDTPDSSSTGISSISSSSGTTDSLTQLQDYFSPEKTAERILDVAMSFFPVSETGQTMGDTVEGRQKFSDFIGAAIDEGFNQARGRLGSLPDDVSAGVDKTHSLVVAGLEDFVKNGVNPEKLAPGGVMEKIAAYRLEGIQNSANLQKAFTSNGYNAKGDAQTLPTETSTISTKG